MEEELRPGLNEAIRVIFGGRPGGYEEAIEMLDERLDATYPGGLRGGEDMPKNVNEVLAQEGRTEQELLVHRIHQFMDGKYELAYEAVEDGDSVVVNAHRSDGYDNYSMKGRKLIVTFELPENVELDDEEQGLNVTRSNKG